MIHKGKLINSKLFKPESYKDLLRLEETSRDDLLKLANQIGINIKVDWASNYKKYSKSDALILNIGDGIGTHWIATYDGKTFDPFGLPPDLGLEHLQWTPIQIQDIKTGYCGQYCLFWLSYALADDISGFYTRFSAL